MSGGALIRTRLQLLALVRGNGLNRFLDGRTAELKIQCQDLNPQGAQTFNALRWVKSEFRRQSVFFYQS